MSFPVDNRTRQFENSKLSLYLGGPKKLLPTEFLILRDSLQRCFDLQHENILTNETNSRNISMPNKFSVVAKGIITKWSKSNSEFKKPVVYSQKAIQQRLNQASNTFSEIAQGKARKATREEWEPKLDADYQKYPFAGVLLFFAVINMPLAQMFVNTRHTVFALVH